MTAWWNRLTAWIAASLVTFALASLAHSLMVQRELAALDVLLPASVRLSGIARDLAGLAGTLGPVLALALAAAFALAGLLRPRAGRLAPFAFPLAGFAAVALALGAMRLFFGFSPLAGARTAAGFLLISLSGLAGGLVFAWIARRRR